MGLFSRIFGSERRSLQQLPTVANKFLPLLFGMFGGGRSDTGVHVDEVTALTASAVWACVSVISDAIAALPVHVVDDDDATKQVDHPAYRLLHDSPNDFMTAITFRRAMLANLLLWGNGYAYIDRDPLGYPQALYPLKAADTRPVRFNGQLYYITRVGDSMQTLMPWEMMHILSMTIDGLTGLSPIEYARQTVGLSLAAERFSAKFFSNGGNMSGILQIPPGMSPEAKQNFMDTWKEKYGGIDNAMKLAALPDGFKYIPTGTDPEKSSLIATRTYQLREVARIYKVPAHKIGDLERSTNNNVEQQALEFVQDCLLPHIVGFEQECNRKLFLESEKPRLQTKFNLDALLRADTMTRYQSYMIGRQAGFLSVNDIRSKEGLSEVVGGDILLQPLNMAPVGTPAPSPTATPAPATANKSASRSIIEDAARRVLTKEMKAITRAAKKFGNMPDEFRSWVDQFYRDHEPLVRRVFAAPLKAAGIADDGYAATHCTVSRDAMMTAIESRASIDDVLDVFETIRPGDIAESLIPI